MWVSLAGFAALAVSYVIQDSTVRWRIIYGDYLYHSVNAYCVVAIIWGAAYAERSPLGLILNSPPLVMIGVLSYSIYLWQEPFLVPTQPFPQYHLLLNLSAIALAATLSYKLVEQPFRRLRFRLAAPTRTPHASRARAFQPMQQMEAQPQTR
jgi:peptidoglycan/LPS O-acetylase OafA/YrhL